MTTAAFNTSRERVPAHVAQRAAAPDVVESPTSVLNIAILGTGSIGSTFAFHFARNAHAVTVIARGKRLAQLQAEQAIVTVGGQRAAVQVSPVLDPAVAYDLVLVTVLASQVDGVLPGLRASAAKRVMFMFNTFESLRPLRDAVGTERFAFGFPAIVASLPDGRLNATVVTRPHGTLVTDARWAQVFTDAGIGTAVQPDMESWLRTHAAVVVPLMAMSVVVHARQAGIAWAEAISYARALREGLNIVRLLGNRITPSVAAMLRWVPTTVVAAGLWSLSQLKFTRQLGAAGPLEPRTLIDAMQAAAPNQSSVLRLIKP